jgi:hypothetical protein
LQFGAPKPSEADLQASLRTLQGLKRSFSYKLLIRYANQCDNITIAKYFLRDVIFQDYACFRATRELLQGGFEGPIPGTQVHASAEMFHEVRSLAFRVKNLALFHDLLARVGLVLRRKRNSLDDYEAIRYRLNSKHGTKEGMGSLSIGRLNKVPDPPALSDRHAFDWETDLGRDLGEDEFDLDDEIDRLRQALVEFRNLRETLEADIARIGDQWAKERERQVAGYDVSGEVSGSVEQGVGSGDERRRDLRLPAAVAEKYGLHRVRAEQCVGSGQSRSRI